MTTSRRHQLSVADGYPEEFKLLELTPEILSQLESSASSSSSLTVRGRATDIAVLVDSKDNVYKMTTAHTSNNLYLLTQDGEEELTVRAKLNQVFDIQPAQPQISTRLAEILSWDNRGPFKGVEFEADMDVDNDDSGDNRVTDDVLARHIQAGKKHLRKELTDIPAFQETSTGHWRILDPGYCMDLLRLILATQVEKDWSLDALDAVQVFETLSRESDSERLLPEVIEAVLSRFGRLVDEDTVYVIDNTRVARYLAEQIFATEGQNSWAVSDFLMALRAVMPPQLAMDVIEDNNQWSSVSIPTSLVRDMAYASTPVDSQMIHTPAGVSYHLTYLNPTSRKSLSNEPRVRMRELFSIKPRWSRAEIVPYLEGLANVDMDLLESGDEKAISAVNKAIDGWLIKFGRGIKNQSGVTVYTSRLN